MLQAMQGYLTEKPRVVDETGPDGRHFRMAMTNIMYHDGRPGSQYGLVRVIAWNAQAEHLARYDAGDEIQFIGRLNAVRARDRPGDKDLAELSFTIQRIDDSCTLVSAMEQFLREFTPPAITLSDKIQQAELQKERNANSGREPTTGIQQQ